MEKNLKPCPFCGETPTYNLGNEHSYIGGWSNDAILSCCIQKSVSFGEGAYHKDEPNTEEQAKIILFDNWNNRFVPPPTPQEQTEPMSPEMEELANEWAAHLDPSPVEAGGETEPTQYRRAASREGKEKDFELIRKSDSDNGFDISFNMTNLEEYEKAQNCRSVNGKTVGLIDAMITCLHFLRQDIDISSKEVQEALEDFRGHENLQRLLGTPHPPIGERLTLEDKIAPQGVGGETMQNANIEADRRYSIPNGIKDSSIIQSFKRQKETFLEGVEWASRTVQPEGMNDDIDELKKQLILTKNSRDWNVKRVKELESQQPTGGEWISVEDRLPQKDQRILTLCQWQNPKQPIQYDVDICNYVIEKVFGNKKGELCFMNEQDEQPSELHPTHWQPLPPPPLK